MVQDKNFLNESYKILQNKIFHQNIITNDAKNLIHDLCETVKKEQVVKSNSQIKEKIDLIDETMKSLTNQIINPLTDVISDKFTEY